MEFPARLSDVERGSGRGWFSYSDGNACILKKGARTSFQPAAAAIATSCMCLYNKPEFEGEMCDGPWRQYRQQ